jgi:transaldolase
MPKKLNELRVKIFADGAEQASMVALAKDPLIKGLTTNPTLMRKAGVTDYAEFAKAVLAEIKDKPISFEVFSDDFTEMERQARIINAWAPNVYVKIPVTNTKKESAAALIKKLAAEGIKLNVTAILTAAQVAEVSAALAPSIPAVVSVFAGRIADTGVDPMSIMIESKKILAANPEHELLWASPREFYNIYQAEEVGADIITVTPDILKKAEKIGYSLDEFSRETVQMFYDDGHKAGYSLY